MTCNIAKPMSPNTATYHTYIDQIVTPILYDRFNRAFANSLLSLLRYLERARYDFSSDRAFQTKPLAMEQLASHFIVSVRSVQRWFAALEGAGVAARVYRKNKDHRFKNWFNRVAFTGFATWFKEAKKTARDAACRPKKQISTRLNLDTRNLDQEGSAAAPDLPADASVEVSKAKKVEKRPVFPASGGLSYELYWRNLALEHLPARPHTPCTTLTAEAFRKHLKAHGIPFHSPNITKLWVSFCKRRYPVK